MNNFQKIGIVFLLILSIGFNLIFYFRLADVSTKLGDVNKLISSNVERNIRQSMRYSKELKDTNSPDSLKNLQRSIQELAVTYKHWIDLNQSDNYLNLQMSKSLSGIEALRNAFIHHLDIQYQTNNNALQDYDIEFLDKAYENLDRLLMVYLNLDGNITKLRNTNKDYGLTQVVNNIEEMTKLYRHSAIPNKHPKYIAYEDAVKVATELFPKLDGLEVKSDKLTPYLKDGIHYYELKYKQNNDIISIVCIDAINSQLRNYELKTNFNPMDDITQGEAFENAKAYVSKFYMQDVISEHYKITTNGKKGDVYSYKFTPTLNDIPFVSDAYTVNVDADTGNIIKFSNDSVNIEMPKYKILVTSDEILQTNLETNSNMVYRGLAVVRSFQTRYSPTVAHSFKSIQKDQEMILFYDVASGVQIHQIINVYETVN